MNENPKFTAILPTYNSVEFLKRSIQSLVDQTEPFDEIIIIDDGSTDETAVVIHSFMANDAKINLIKHEKNEGVCAALNHGIEAATGDYILLCASDDWYDPNAVALAKKLAKMHSAVGLIAGDAVMHREDGKPYFKNNLRTVSLPKKNQFYSAAEFKKIIQKNHISFNGGGTFYNRKLVLASGMLNPDLRWHSDWLLHFVCACRQGVYYADHIFVNVTLRARGYAEGRKNWKNQKQVLIATIQTLKDQFPELLNTFKSAALLPHYATRYLPLFLLKLRSYITLGLIWKLIASNAMMIRIANLLPYSIALHIRNLIKA